MSNGLLARGLPRSRQLVRPTAMRAVVGLWASIPALFVLAAIVAYTDPAFAQQHGVEAARTVVVAPHGNDYSVDSLRRYILSLEQTFGSNYRDIPLAVRAEFFEWELWRYHLTDYGQVYNRADLSHEHGKLPRRLPGPDSSTWNGALLAALAYEYAVIHREETLNRIRDLMAGVHLFFTVTGQPGLPARNVTPADGPVLADQTGRYVGPDGRQYAFRSDAAKGTINQLAGGYITLLVVAGDQLPPDVNRMARDDLAAMALHLIEHDYHLTEANGSRTRYGDLTPLVARVGVPFNAQVAYLVVGGAHYFPPDDASARARIAEAYNYLRLKHHVYYEDPLRNLILPQRVGGSALVKGMNDRMHVMYAAYLGLMIDIRHARKHNLELDRRFVRQLGQTMVHGMQYLWAQHNSLCNFMWSGLISDANVFECILPRGREVARQQADWALVDGVEQLRRFRLDRFNYPGRELQVWGTVYNDSYMPDDYYWKVNPDRVYQPTGPRSETYSCAIDYLHAYWMLRYFRLDQHPAVVKQHGPVIQARDSVVSRRQ